MQRIVLGAALAVATSMVATPALADSYRVNANATSEISLNVCSPQVSLTVRGDGDTDLDFSVTNSSGQTVHSDYDTTDITFATLNRRSGIECENFNLVVSNLGNVFNVFEVTLEALGAAPSGGGATRSYRANADSTSRVGFEVCGPSARIDVAGDGDTDLDYRIYDPAGNLVHSDYALGDRTSTIVNPGRSGCANYAMETVNLGSVFNMYQVTVTPMAQAAGTGGSADGRNRAVSLANNTGETILFLYWSNSGANSWGEDRLGSANTLSSGQNWNVTVDDGSGACRFDFKATLAGGREVELRGIDVCTSYSITFN